MRQAPLAGLLSLGLFLLGCSQNVSDRWSLALEAEDAGDLVQARDLYESMLAETGDPDLAGVLSVKIASLDWALHDEGRAFESLHGAAAQNPDVVLLSLGRALDFQDGRSRDDLAMRTRDKLLDSVLSNPRLKEAASMRARRLREEMDDLIRAGDVDGAARLSEAFLARIPPSLLDPASIASLKRMEATKALAKKIRKTTSANLEVGKSKVARDVPDEALSFFAMEEGDRALSPGGEKVLVRKRGPDNHVYVFAGRPGEEPSQVRGSRGAVRPSWAGRGESILFTRYDTKEMTRSIELVSAKGGKPRTLFAAGSQLGLTAAWSPVASKVAFVYAGDIWVMNGDGTEVHKLTSGLDLDRKSPVGWSQDGTQIFYETYRKVGGRTVRSGQVSVLLLEQA